MPLPIRIDRIAIEYLLQHLLRFPDLFRSSRELLQPQYFNRPGETIYRVIWMIACDQFNVSGELLTGNPLSTLTLSALQTSPTTSREDLQEADSFLRWVFEEQPAAYWNRRVAIDLLHYFLMERGVQDTLTDTIQHADGHYLPQLPSVLQTVEQQIRRFDALRPVEISLVVPDDCEHVVVDKLPSGVPLVDSRMDGGSEPREVHVVIGATGVGKTLLGFQMICSMARLNHVQSQSSPSARKLFGIFSYEDSETNLRLRAQCAAASIDARRLRQLPRDQLTRTGNTLDYERRLFPGMSVEQIPGEYDRLMAVRPWLNDHVCIFDFSGTPNPNRPSVMKGFGGVAEIRQTIDSVMHERQREFGAIVIDWAGSAVKNYLIAKNLDVDSKQATALATYVDEVRCQIAAEFGCPVWIMHQLAGKYCQRSPAVMPHHSEADHCKSFANYAYYAFVIGTKDQETSTCLFGATKTRRGEGSAPVVLKIDGNLGRVVEADAQYTVDPTTRRIVARRDLDAVPLRRVQPMNSFSVEVE